MEEPASKYNATAVESVFSLLEGGDPEIKELIQLIRDKDWSETAIGPYTSWPGEATAVLYFTMISTQPQCLLVGPELTLLYNPAFARMLRDHRVALFCRPLWSCLEWEPYFEIIANCLNFGVGERTKTEKEIHLTMPNGGRLEELVISATTALLPPSLRGSYVIFEDNTERFVRERRTATLQAMSESWSRATDLLSLWDLVLESLNDRPHEFPFAAVYTVKKGYDPENLSGLFDADSDGFEFDLHGSIGAFNGSLPNPLNKKSSSETHFQCLLQATASRSPVVLVADDGTLPESWSHASDLRGYCEPARAAAVFPCSSNQFQYAKAILLIGLATRSPYNEAYQYWINEIHRKFGDAVGIVIAAQEAARKREEAVQQKLEEVEQERLEKEVFAKELARHSKEASQATSRVEKVLAVMNEIDVGFFEYAITGELLDANNAFHQLSGIPQDPTLNGPLVFNSRVYPDDADMVMSKWALCLQGKTTTFEMRWKSDSPEGWQWVVAACVPILDDKGAPQSIWGMTTNIGAQKKVEQEAIKRAEALEQARAIEARFFRFAEIAPVGILVAEPSGLVSYCNKNWMDMTDHPLVEAMHEINFRSIVYEGDLPVLDSNWKEVSVDGIPRSWQMRLEKLWSSSEGEARGHVWCMVTTLPEFNDDGSVKQVIGALMDISHLKFAESVQQMQMEEALEAKRQQENFIDMTSHEIRNPLGAVIQCADSISDSLAEMRKLLGSLPPLASTNGGTDPLDSNETRKTKRKLFHEQIESSIEAADTIKSCSEHQRRIVNDILTLSKMDSKLLQLAPSPVDAVALLHDLFRMFAAEAEHAGVEIEIQSDPSIATLGVQWVVLDPGRVLQVLVNLVTNAIKFTKSRNAIRRVTVCIGSTKERPIHLPVDFVVARTIRDSIYNSEEFSEDPCYLWFSVQDTGCGMTAEEQARIFSRFSQASRRTYNQYGGSGLGLFISRELVEMQGGEIGVASQPNSGSTFAFFIKTHKTAAPAQEAAKPTSNGPKAAEATDQDKVPSVISVLVVEDNAVNQRVLKKQLQKHGYRVHVADHGLEALDFIRTTRHWKDVSTATSTPQDLDVILMDVEMPKMDGLTCTKRIREFERDGSIRSHIPIIAVSANARPEQINQTVVAGMDEAVSKPFRIPDLTPRIDRLANWARNKEMDGRGDVGVRTITMR